MDKRTLSSAQITAVENAVAKLGRIKMIDIKAPDNRIWEIVKNLRTALYQISGVEGEEHTERRIEYAVQMLHNIPQDEKMYPSERDAILEATDLLKAAIFHAHTAAVDSMKLVFSGRTISASLRSTPQKLPQKR